MTVHADWSDGFGERLYAKLRAKGYTTATQFLEAHRGATYKSAAEALGAGVAPAHLSELQFNEAEQSGTMRIACMDALVRAAAKFIPDGWGAATDYERAKFASFWICAVDLRAPHRKWFAERLSKVWDELVRLSPPATWSPESTDDDFIVRAFDIGWPENEPPPKEAAKFAGP